MQIFLTQIQGLNTALLAPTHSRFHTSYFTTPNSLHFATPYMIDRVECIYISGGILALASIRDFL